MIVGGNPFHTASKNDKMFTSIINGQLSEVLKMWKKDIYVNQDIMQLFNGFFQFEDKRIDILGIKILIFIKSDSML